jgi:hypothetical protein
MRGEEDRNEDQRAQVRLSEVVQRGGKERKSD